LSDSRTVSAQPGEGAAPPGIAKVTTIQLKAKLLDSLIPTPAIDPTDHRPPRVDLLSARQSAGRKLCLGGLARRPLARAGTDMLTPHGLFWTGYREVPAYRIRPHSSVSCPVSRHCCAETWRRNTLDFRFLLFAFLCAGFGQNSRGARTCAQPTETRACLWEILESAFGRHLPGESLR